METERMHQSLVLYEYAMSFLGLPYNWGGDDPIKGFDCSGLVCEILQAAGVIKHRADYTAKGLHDLFTETLTEAKFGSLAFYGTSIDKISHVGFCFNQKMVLEAGSGDSSTTSADQAAKQNAFIRIRPIKYRSDFLCLKHPTYSWKEE